MPIPSGVFTQITEMNNIFGNQALPSQLLEQDLVKFI